MVDDETRSQVLALARDFPRLWKDAKTPHRERKRMARLILEDVTLVKGQDQLTVQIRFKGGATRSLSLARPVSAFEEWKTPPEIVEEIDRLLDDYTDGEIANILNERGLTSGCGNAFHARRVQKTRRAYRLKSRYTRLHERGWLNLHEVSKKLGVCGSTVKKRRAEARLGLRSIKVDDTGQYMYENPDTKIISACSEEV